MRSIRLTRFILVFGIAFAALGAAGIVGQSTIYLPLVSGGAQKIAFGR